MASNPLSVQPLTTTPAQTSTSVSNSLQIDAKNLSGLPAPGLSVGDVVNLTVRQNPVDGLGLVALKGLLINAALPNNLHPGDRIQAEIIQKGDRVIFKLIGEILSANPSPQSVQAKLVKVIENQFREIFNSISAPQLRLLQAESVTSAIKNAGYLKKGAIERLIDNLFKTLPSGERLFTPNEILKELINSATGSQLKALRDLSKSLRSLVGEQQVSPDLSKLKDLETELSSLLLDSAKNNFTSASLLKNISTDLESVNKNSIIGLRPGLEPIAKNLLEQLQSTINSGADKTNLNPSISTLMLTLQEQIIQASSLSGSLDTKTIEQLLRIAGQLDKLADTEEALNRINPLLQALGEPAMILFPFLFQGLLAHTDIIFQTPTKRKKHGDKSKEENLGNSQRVTLNIPLPNLGCIEVDILLKESEMLIRLKIGNKMAEKFVASNFKDLQAELNRLGYEKVELITTISDDVRSLPEWSMNLDGFSDQIKA